jgi:hypothetical protein
MDGYAMTLVKRRSKAVINPFVYTDEFGEENMLFSGEVVDINIEDIVLGCVRSLKAAEPETNYRDFVNAGKILRLFQAVNTITTESVKNYLRCTDRLAQKYMQVIRLCVPFIVKHLARPNTNIIGYKDSRSSPIYVVNRAEMDSGPV